MILRCPACQMRIQHNELDGRPRAHQRYRCHICRLELVLDPKTDRLAVAPLRSDEADQRERRTD